MQSLYRALNFIMILTLGGACAHYADRLKSDLDPWIGQHPDRLVEEWGAPSSNYTMENGTKVLSYVNDRQVSRTSSYGYYSWRLSSYSYSESCKINFFTDAGQKKIEKYSTVGDASSCVEVLRDIKRSPN